MASPYMKQLEIENMVSDGGYGITVDGNLLGIEPLNRQDIADLILECETRGFPWGLSVDNSDMRLVPDHRFYEATHDDYLRSVVVPGLDPLKQENIYKAYVSCPEPEEYTLQALKKLPWCRYMPAYFFVEPTDKAVGIRRMMDCFHADYGDAIVFGDGLNDLSMFTDEWIRVAMGNAVPELKAKADIVTTAVDEDGIWNACLELGLFEE